MESQWISGGREFALSGEKGEIVVLDKRTSRRIIG
jgi:hypothetical protein